MTSIVERPITVDEEGLAWCPSTKGNVRPALNHECAAEIVRLREDNAAKDAEIGRLREALTKIAASEPEAYDECCGGGVQTSHDEPPECCAQPIRENAGREIARAALKQETAANG